MTIIQHHCVTLGLNELSPSGAKSLSYLCLPLNQLWPQTYNLVAKQDGANFNITGSSIGLFAAQHQPITQTYIDP